MEEEREININIEGYNVNGICVGCLNYNRRMMYHDDVKECFKILGNIDIPQGISVSVCWECVAAVQNVIRFKNTVNASYEVLISYSRTHTFLASPLELSTYATTRLSVRNTTCHTEEVVADEAPVKHEDLDVKLEYFDDTNAIDNQNAEDTNDPPDLTLPDDIDIYEPQQSSDEDIKLSDLKAIKKEKRKEKKLKKRNDKPKKSQKLRNLPEDFVKTVTLSEEDMWCVRKSDVENEVFVNSSFKCNECIRLFNSSKLMNDHLQAKHTERSPETFQCDVCHCYFLTRDNITPHRDLHKSAYKCKKCGYRTTVKKLMLAHVTQQHGTGGMKCNLCGDAFPTKSKLQYHKNVCKQEKPQCDCCGKVFANKVTLKYHLKIWPSVKSEDKNKEPQNIICKGCDKVFTSKKSYRAHAVIHEGVQYPCSLCGKLFQWKRNLARHMRNHQDRESGARHECKLCGKRFSSRDCYNNHMRLSKRHVAQHDLAYSHECGYCGKRFASKWCLVDHVDWEHLKRMKYICQHCHKPFKTAKIMVAHVNNIHGQKKKEPDGEHLCDICGKSYKTVKRLKGHVWAMHTRRSGTGTAGYRCPLCPATFSWQTSTYKHMKIMHRGQGTGNRSAPKQEFEVFSQFPALPSTQLL